MVGWSLLTDFDATKRAGMPVLVRCISCNDESKMLSHGGLGTVKSLIRGNRGF